MKDRRGLLVATLPGLPCPPQLNPSDEEAKGKRGKCEEGQRPHRCLHRPGNPYEGWPRSCVWGRSGLSADYGADGQSQLDRINRLGQIQIEFCAREEGAALARSGCRQCDDRHGQSLPNEGGA